jgi:hypothetical protein
MLKWKKERQKKISLVKVVMDVNKYTWLGFFFYRLGLFIFSFFLSYFLILFALICFLYFYGVFYTISLHFWVSL